MPTTHPSGWPLAFSGTNTSPAPRVARHWYVSAMRRANLANGTSTNRYAARVAQLVLTVAAIATLWSGFQASEWDDRRAPSYGQATTRRLEASAASTLGGQLLVARHREHTHEQPENPRTAHKQL
jgi:hypothetical protein